VALQLCARQPAQRRDILLDLSQKRRPIQLLELFFRRGASVRLIWSHAIRLAGCPGKTTLPALFDRILVDTGYQLYIDDGTEEGMTAVKRPRAAEPGYEYEERGLTAFLENLALVSDQDTLPEEPNVPTLMTLHAAKGLEFPQVFISGLDEGLLRKPLAGDPKNGRRTAFILMWV